MDIWDFFDRRRREIERYSVAIERFDDRAFLSVRERVAFVGGRFHIAKYSYYLVIDGAELWGFDKAPDHEVVVHGHVGPAHERVESPELALSEVVERAWTTLSSYYE